MDNARKKELNMRIVIDGQCFQSGSIYRGIGRYVCGLISGLLEFEVDVKLILNGGMQEKAVQAARQLRDLIGIENIIYFYPPSPIKMEDIGSISYDDAEDLYVCRVLEEEPDYYIAPAPFEVVGCENIILPLRKLKGKVKIATVVHDFIPYENIELYLGSRRAKMAYRASLDAIGYSDLFFTNSNFVKEGCNKYYPYIDSYAIYGGGTLPECSKSCIESEKKYFLYYGGLDPRKNVQFLIEAYSKLRGDIRGKCLLYIVGGANKTGINEIKKKIKEYGCERDCKVYEYVSDEELSTLIEEAYCFIFPSLYEGLGLPVLEAMERGVPCICSNVTALREIYTLAEGQFSPVDNESLVNLLQRLVEDVKLLERLKRYSLEQRVNFTWKKSAERILNALNKTDIYKKKTLNKKELYAEFLLLKCRSESASKLLSKALRRQCSSLLYIDVSNFVINGKLSQNLKLNEIAERAFDDFASICCDALPIIRDARGKYRRIKVCGDSVLPGLEVEFSAKDFILKSRTVNEDYMREELLGLTIREGDF